MNFDSLRLCEPIVRAIADEGYTTATPIQAQAIPPALEGHDVLGCAQTGTGKTCAFALPILERLNEVKNNQPGRVARALVLCPTRELATQTADCFKAYGRHLRLQHTTIFGGVSQVPQVRRMNRGVDVLIATPGRLMDLMDQGHVMLDGIEVLALDEADRMLDMGFIHDIRRIIKEMPEERQTLLFSATVSKDIRRLTDTIMRSPVTVEVTPQATTVDKITQSVFFVEKMQKPEMLTRRLREPSVKLALVFSRTKHGADRLVKGLERAGIRAAAIHGDKSQNNRNRALEGFRSGRVPVLVATDVAARGIDVDDVTHVINYDLPNEPETYVHRIGRTARAGASGEALSFCDKAEIGDLRAIERLIGMRVPVSEEEADLTYEARPPREQHERRDGGRGRQGGKKPGNRSNNRNRTDSRSDSRADNRSGARDGGRPTGKPGKKKPYGKKPFEKAGNKHADRGGYADGGSTQAEHAPGQHPPKRVKKVHRKGRKRVEDTGNAGDQTGGTNTNEYNTGYPKGSKKGGPKGSKPPKRRNNGPTGDANSGGNQSGDHQGGPPTPRRSRANGPNAGNGPAKKSRPRRGRPSGPSSHTDDAGSRTTPKPRKKTGLRAKAPGGGAGPRPKRGRSA